MKITQNFISDLQRLKVEISIVLNQAQQRTGSRDSKIPKLAGFKKFLRIYLGMSATQQLDFAPELKRRMIRQQIVFAKNEINIPSVEQLFTNSFRRMNDIPGDRSVPLTCEFSCVKCR